TNPSMLFSTQHAPHRCVSSCTRPATTELYTLSLHDALPICGHVEAPWSGTRSSTAFLPQTTARATRRAPSGGPAPFARPAALGRSEEHTSELQSRENLVCRLLLEKKKKEKNEKGVVTRPAST